MWLSQVFTWTVSSIYSPSPWTTYSRVNALSSSRSSHARKRSVQTINDSCWRSASKNGIFYSVATFAGITYRSPLPRSARTKAGGLSSAYVPRPRVGRARERDQRPRSRGLARHGRGTYEQDNRPCSFLYRDTEQQYVVPTKSADEPTVWLLLADRQQKSLTVYIDGFCAYDPLAEDDQFDRAYVVYGDGEYADKTVHVNTCESYASLA